jgi:hypothetical protein
VVKTLHTRQRILHHASRANDKILGNVGSGVEKALDVLLNVFNGMNNTLELYRSLTTRLHGATPLFYVLRRGLIGIIMSRRNVTLRKSRRSILMPMRLGGAHDISGADGSVIVIIRVNSQVELGCNFSHTGCGQYSLQLEATIILSLGCGCILFCAHD